MHRIMHALALIGVASSFLLAACQSGATPGTSSVPGNAISSKPTVSPPAERTAWDNLVAAAQKEGSVAIAVAFPSEAREAVTTAFKQKYGTTIDWVVGPPADLQAKINQEQNAGLYAVDIGIVGIGPYIFTFKPMTVPLAPLLALPEVKDAAKWRAGEVPFYDANSVEVNLFALQFYIDNPDLVGKGEMPSAVDLLNPKWKGKIIISDPRITGQANDWFTTTLEVILGKEKGIQFMKDLLAQDPVITRDDRLLTESVAHGKYAIGVSPSTSVPIEFINKGARVEFVDVKDPRELSPGHGLIYAFQNAPHPNAQKLFVNWVLSKEGGSVFASALGYPSSRLDVPTDSFLPVLVPRQGDVEVYKKFDFPPLRTADTEIAKQIFAGR